MASNWQKFLIVALGTQQVLSACAAPSRLAAVPVSEIPRAVPSVGPVRFNVTRETDTFLSEARNALAKEEQWLANSGRPGPLQPAYYLAISGGGDNGAYGAGFLNGWTAAGTRPQFKGVTGISTGALIAPFAFLGPKYDYVLKRVYTTTSQKDIFKKRGIIKGFFGDGMTDSRPLARTIATYVNRQLLDEIAAEYAKGRLLLVGTANLDSMEPVVWNMTAIAASKNPGAMELFSKVLLASASIPGAFPPVMIDVTADGHRYQEMHVDGGTMTQVFLYPPALKISDAPPRQRILYVIRNARLDPDWASTERRTLTIAGRAIASLTRTQGVGDLYRIYATTQRDGVDFNLTFIPATFNVPHREEFDTAYMNALYAVGEKAARSGYSWEKYPPGFMAPATSPTAAKGQ